MASPSPDENSHTENATPVIPDVAPRSVDPTTMPTLLSTASASDQGATTGITGVDGAVEAKDLKSKDIIDIVEANRVIQTSQSHGTNTDTGSGSEEDQHLPVVSDTASTSTNGASSQINRQGIEGKLADLHTVRKDPSLIRKIRGVGSYFDFLFHR